MATGAVVELSDDEVPDSDAPPAKSSTGSRIKRPAAEDGIKIEWTDDEDDRDVRAKFAKRKGKRKAATDRKSTASLSAAAKKQKRQRADADLESGVNGVDESVAVDRFDSGDIPEYLVQRRQEFDQSRERLKEAGLRLPPDYADVYFSDDERGVGRLARKPKFDEASGIKPCRTYEDVELPYSAGIIPASIAQYLREYQVQGVRFLHELFVYQKGGVLGDDMGLGKTVQVAAFLTAAFGKTGDVRDAKRMRKMRRAVGEWYPRVLIICPGSLIVNWRTELMRWDWWVVDTFHGTGKEDVLQAAKAGMVEVMITTYQTYKNCRDGINSVKWDCVVADECHLFKERDSGITKAMNEVNALCRIGLTGTAIQNKYEELWTLLNWCNPGQVGTIREWIHTISRPLGRGQSHDATMHELSVARKTAKKLVYNLLPQFFLRRMKSLIADQLPKKSDKVVFCPLTSIQREAYENFLQSERVEFVRTASDACPCGSERKRGWCCYSHLPNGKPWQAAVFPVIQTLQKLSNHVTLLIPSARDGRDKQENELETLQLCLPERWAKLYRDRESLLTLSNPEFCGKWAILKKLLVFWHANGDKVLIFSHSVRLLRILHTLFNNTSYSVSYLDGSLSYDDRQQAVDDFNSDSSQFVFLISTKAGGVGLNITSANKVVIFDPHWNPSYDLQAQDRAYRIGQIRDVDVFRLISAGTIEETVYARQIYKQQQANIGYNASNERRYFTGVQQEPTRKGEIFGLHNLLAFYGNQVMLRDIVNKTNIAEAKAGVHLSDVDMESMVKVEVDGIDTTVKKENEDPDSALHNLADYIASQGTSGKVKRDENDFLASKSARLPKTDAIQAILASAGVEYTHENSEVIGSSKVEAQLSRRAEMVTDHPSPGVNGDGSTIVNNQGREILFAERQANSLLTDPSGSGVNSSRHSGKGSDRIYRYNPPEDVMRRQFCSMAREFGFSSVTDFALVVESWTQEQRRGCLDEFYKRREMGMMETQGESDVDSEDDGFEGMKAEVKAEIRGEILIDGIGMDRRPNGSKDLLVRAEENGPPLTKEERSSTIFIYDDDEDDEL